MSARMLLRASLLWATVSWVAHAYLNPNHQSSKTRYFTFETTLPPLASISENYSNDTLTTPYQENHGHSIPVVYTNDPLSVYQWLKLNLPNEPGGIVGFDTESLQTFSRKSRRSSFENAATVQLATPDSCLVAHLVRASGAESQACAPILSSVLNDKRYIKAGCAIDEDMMALFEIWDGLDAKSRLDLGFIGSQQEKQRIGLKALAAKVVGVDLPKPRSVTLSDWSCVPLTERQIAYCARDAWAGAAIARKLAESNPNIFGTESLMDILEESELPISKLVQRQRRRDNAKRDLGRLLGPFKGRSKVKLPKRVKRKAKNLREVIKSRIIEPSLVLGEDSFIDFDI